jgi:hypothetical protein
VHRRRSSIDPRWDKDTTFQEPPITQHHRNPTRDDPVTPGIAAAIAEGKAALAIAATTVHLHNSLEHLKATQP